MTGKESLKGVSPVKLQSIGNKTHVTIEMGMLIRGIAIIAMVVAGYLNFMGRIDRMENTNRSLESQFVVADSLARKDFRIIVEALRKDIATSTSAMVTARETDIREVKASLETEAAALAASIEANSGKLATEMSNLKSLIISANSTTYAELKPTIDNIQNAIDIHAGALDQRISLIEGQMQDQVKRSLFRVFGKGR